MAFPIIGEEIIMEIAHENCPRWSSENALNGGEVPQFHAIVDVAKYPGEPEKPYYSVNRYETDSVGRMISGMEKLDGRFWMGSTIEADLGLPYACQCSVRYKTDYYMPASPHIARTHQIALCFLWKYFSTAM